MDYEELLQMLSDPAMQDQLAQMGVFGDKSKLLNQQMDLAHERSQDPMPQGMHAGGMYIAGNPMQFAAAALQRTRGEKGLQSAMAGHEALIQGDVNARKKLGGGMSQAMQKARPPTEEPMGFVESPQMY